MLARLITVVVLVFLGSYILSTREPRYDGKPLSYWFKEYCRSGLIKPDISRQNETTIALKKISTNAGPYLIEQAFKFQDSPGWSNVCRFLNTLPASWWTPHPVPASVRCDEAPLALNEIKLPAGILLRLIKPHLQSTNMLEHRQSLLILGTAGEGADQVVPYLIPALQDPDFWARGLAIQSLNWLGPKAQAAVPALMATMENNSGTNANIARWAAIALGKIGTNAAPAIPLVRKMFEQSINSNNACMLAGALYRIDPTQEDALDFLIDGVKNYRPANQRDRFVYALGEIGPSARRAVPVLLEELSHSTNDGLLVRIPMALTNMGVAPQRFLPLLKQQLVSPDATTRFNAANRVLMFDPADHEAHAILMKFIRARDQWTIVAIPALGDAGPAAAEALPLLREVEKDNAHPAYRSMARRAIQQIDRDRKKQQ